MTGLKPLQRFQWLRQNVQRYLPVAHYMAISKAKNEVAGTMGGILWWIGEPVIYSFLYYFLFAVVFESKTENFISFLLLGLVIWRWLSRTIKASGNSIVGNSALMRQIDIPKIIFPIQAVIVESYKFLIALAIICGLLAMLGNFSIQTAYIFPLVFLVTFVVLLGIGFVLSAAMPFFPDLKRIIGLGSRALMLVSGVFFEATQIPAEYRIYFYMNPLASLIEGFRDVLFFGQMPDIVSLSIVLMFGIGLCTVGLFIHWRYNRVFPRYLV